MRKISWQMVLGLAIAVGLALPAASVPASAAGASVKFGVCDWTLGKSGDPAALALAGKLGFEGVQVSLDPAGEDLALMKEEARRTFLAAAETTGVAIASFAIGKLNDIPLKSDPRAERWLEQACVIGAAMNVRRVLVPFFGNGDLRNDAKGVDAVVAVLKRLAPKAEKAGIVFALESYLSADENLKIIQRVGSSAVRVYYDVANSSEVGLDIFKEIPALGEKIVEFHAKDNMDLYGKGPIDFTRVRKAMDEIGYVGWFVFEGTKYPLGLEASLRYDLDFLKSVYR
ncbi:MAG: sugar phosphate isomerase/epimerase [Candidatus Aminicenantes bacterium]|nr:sugar phosphate isomerase/epimerase [Candidatus Aminicenantes bacterium]